MSGPTHPTEDDRGWQFAFVRSLSLAKANGLTGHWFAPGFNLNSKLEEMPNAGKCACGAKFYVSDVYHYRAKGDGLWHTRQECT